jgi:hypothetical protein
MPTISVFFGIVIKMFFDEHPPPHFHAEHQGEKAVVDFRVNILHGDIRLKNRRKTDSRMGRPASR